MKAELIVLHHNGKTVCMVEKKFELKPLREHAGYERIGLMIVDGDELSFFGKSMVDVFVCRSTSGMVLRVCSDVSREWYGLKIDGSEHLMVHLQSVSKIG